MSTDYWNHPSTHKRLVILLFLLPFVLFTQDHMRGKLDRDSGIYVYAGQQVLQGVPPYASIFDHKGPLTPLVCAVGIAMARGADVHDLLVVRVIFLAAAAGCVVLVFLIGTAGWRSMRAGWFSALVFLGFWGFAQFASSGPRPKTLMLLFALACIRLGMKRRYFLAGLAGGAAVMVWQPSSVFLLAVATTLALRRPERSRVSEWLRLIAGAGCVPLLCVLYFAWNGALDLFWEGLVGFNIFMLDRGDDGDASFLGILRALHKGYAAALFPLIGGWLVLPWAVLSLRLFGDAKTPAVFMTNRRLYRVEKIPKSPSEETKSVFTTRAGIFLPLWVLVSLWSAADFQGYVDAYPLLPLAAWGFGWFLDRALPSLDPSNRYHLRQDVAVSLFLLLIAWTEVKMNRSFEVNAQRGTLWALHYEIEPGETVRCLGAPELMALAGERQDDRYLFVVNGIDSLIESRHPGGWQGWLDELRDAPPHFILYRPPRGKKVASLNAWIDTHYVTRWETAGAYILEYREPEVDEATKRR